MKLLTLRLENFQGIQAAKYDFQGRNASFYGDNATGKTTIGNAIAWLLFGAPVNGAKNYTPKTIGTDGEKHYLNHSAEGVFQMRDGRIVTLKKVFHEVYKKKRGSASEEMDGHTIDYYIDGVPSREKEYSATLLTFCGGDPEKMKILVLPAYFAQELPWQERRRILLDLCGSVTDADVIAANADLRELPTALLMPGTQNQRYTVDEYRKIAGARKAEINKQLATLPGRIDEVLRAIPDTEGIDLAAIEREARQLADRRDALTDKKAGILAGDTTGANVRAQLAELNAQLAEARTAYLEKADAGNAGLRENLADLRGQIVKIEDGAAAAERELARHQGRLADLQKRRDRLLADYEEEFGEQWDGTQELCPTCGRELPAEKIEAMRDAFNQRRSKRLQTINEQGQREASKDMIAAEETAIAACKEQIEAGRKEIDQLRAQVIALQERIKKPGPFEFTPEYAGITQQITALRDLSADEEKRKEAATQEIEKEFREIYGRASELQGLKALLDTAGAQRARAEELELEQKKLSAEYEDLEKGLYLCELFVRHQAGMVTDAINAHFHHVRFRLFIEQQNGGMRDDCEVLVPGEGGALVPFSVANDAGRLNAGLEIIDVLSRHWGITMPVIVDRAESVTRLAPIAAQVIRLVVVSAEDKRLRMEVDNEEV